ncbi:hypothetical protein [Propionimicrobium sp. PCR01-08-3]|uniref:hypothetical protein n=1 Tax=Propionimicrobium sp. PCR01-08-3 TaxID=3052086 RepID=UPI00255CFE03|nr:hypothetical protein [Propionimicrobium sp. PCR01-08-3]WIY84007.1 hypothetical protein QQ658_06625 [Propionimicrobium sp. PCR01-08-3]
MSMPTRLSPARKVVAAVGGVLTFAGSAFLALLIGLVSETDYLPGDGFATVITVTCLVIFAGLWMMTPGPDVSLLPGTAVGLLGGALGCTAGAILFQAPQWVPAGMVAAAAVLGVLIWIRHFRRRWLFTHGRETVGVLVELSYGSSEGIVIYQAADYVVQYFDENGRLARAAGEASFRTSRMPDVGDAFRLWYDPGKPGRHYVAPIDFSDVDEPVIVPDGLRTPDDQAPPIVRGSSRARDGSPCGPRWRSLLRAASSDWSAGWQARSNRTRRTTSPRARSMVRRSPSSPMPPTPSGTSTCSG